MAKIISSERGKPKLFYNEYGYVKHREDEKKIRWRCDMAKKNKCKAYAYSAADVVDGDIVKVFEIHCHAAVKNKFAMTAARNELKRKAKELRLPARAVVSQVFGDAPSEVAAMAKTGSLMRYVRNHRSAGSPRQPKKLQENWKKMGNTSEEAAKRHDDGVYRPGDEGISPEEEAIATLLKLSVEIRKNAYAPYSKFRVGASLLCEDGTIFTGCNVENAVYPLCICAEQVAITKAVSEGRMKFVAMAVTYDVEGEVATPCGACRQVMTEFGDFDVYLARPDGSYQKVTVKQLLPGAFTPAALRSATIGQ